MKFIQAREAGAIMGLQPSSIYGKATSGSIPSIKIGATRLFEEKQIVQANALKPVSTSNFAPFEDDFVTPFDKITQGYVFPEESK